LLAMFACAMLFSSLIWLLWNDAAIDTTDKDYERTPVARIARLVPYQQRVFPIDTDVPRGCIELQEYLASLRVAPLISENTGAALLAGKTLLITDPYSYGELVKTGRLPEAPLLEMLRAHRVGAVVLAHEAGRLRVEKDSRWTPAFLAAVEQDYRLARSFQCTNGSAVYLPR